MRRGERAERMARERTNDRIACRGEFGRFAPLPRHTRVCSCCFGYNRTKPKDLCVVCRKTVALGVGACPTCGSLPVRLGYHVRVPRRSASDKQWSRFLRQFAPSALARRPQGKKGG